MNTAEKRRKLHNIFERLLVVLEEAGSLIEEANRKITALLVSFPGYDPDKEGLLPQLVVADNLDNSLLKYPPGLKYYNEISEIYNLAERAKEMIRQVRRNIYQSLDFYEYYPVIHILSNKRLSNITRRLSKFIYCNKPFEDKVAWYFGDVLLDIKTLHSDIIKCIEELSVKEKEKYEGQLKEIDRILADPLETYSLGKDVVEELKLLRFKISKKLEELVLREENNEDIETCSKILAGKILKK